MFDAGKVRGGTDQALGWFRAARGQAAPEPPAAPIVPASAPVAPAPSSVTAPIAVAPAPIAVAPAPIAVSPAPIDVAPEPVAAEAAPPAAASAEPAIANADAGLRSEAVAIASETPPGPAPRTGIRALDAEGIGALFPRRFGAAAPGAAADATSAGPEAAGHAERLLQRLRIGRGASLPQIATGEQAAGRGVAALRSVIESVGKLTPRR